MDKLANQDYWEAQGYKLVPDPDTEKQAAAKQTARDAAKSRNSESVREMFKAGS